MNVISGKEEKSYCFKDHRSYFEPVENDIVPATTYIDIPKTFAATEGKCFEQDLGVETHGPGSTHYLDTTQRFAHTLLGSVVTQDHNEKQGVFPESDLVRWIDSTEVLKINQDGLVIKTKVREDSNGEFIKKCLRERKRTSIINLGL